MNPEKNNGSPLWSNDNLKVELQGGLSPNARRALNLAMVLSVGISMVACGGEGLSPREAEKLKPGTYLTVIEDTICYEALTRTPIRQIQLMEGDIVVASGKTFSDGSVGMFGHVTGVSLQDGYFQKHCFATTGNLALLGN